MWVETIRCPANAGTAGPFTQLPGDDNGRTMMSANFTVTMDSKVTFMVRSRKYNLYGRVERYES